MNADLQKLRDSRLFRSLPDRAFERVKPYIKIKAFENADQVLDLKLDKTYERYFGYVLTGRVLFVGDGDKPLGLSSRDEFFLGRSFSIGEHPVRKLVSAHPETLVVYIRKEIFEILSANSDNFAHLIDDMYDSIFERAELMSSDVKGVKAYQDWLKDRAADTALANWIAQIEKRRDQIAAKKLKEKREKKRLGILWSFAGLILLGVSLESFFIANKLPWSLMYFLTGEFHEFEPGSDFNIALGIIGYVLIVATNFHTLSKWAMKKFKWKFDFKLSSQLHMLFGVMGAFFILYHVAFRLEGANVAHYALYAMLIGIMSGMVGQVISSQIPKSIRGEKLKLDSLAKEQKKLKQQAELLMDDRQYKTSVAMMAEPLPSGFWANIFGFHRYWFRKLKVKKTLTALGMGAESARLASHLLASELKLRQKIRSLEIANQIFRRWMIIHKPFGYAVYILGGLHIILVTLLT